MRHLLEEVDSGHLVALKACRHFVSNYNLACNRTVICEKWGSLPLGSRLLPPDLEPCHWSSTFTERLARFVRTGIPCGLGEAALRQSILRRPRPAFQLLLPILLLLKPSLPSPLVPPGLPTRKSAASKELRLPSRPTKTKGTSLGKFPSLSHAPSLNLGLALTLGPDLVLAPDHACAPTLVPATHLALARLVPMTTLALVNAPIPTTMPF